MNKKLVAAYTYLDSQVTRVDVKAGKIIWLADKNHFIRFGRTVSGRSLPCAILPELKTDYVGDPEYGAYGELSNLIS